MKLSLSEEQQSEMRLAHWDGAPGVFVSGVVWVSAAVVCHLMGINQAVWALLIGGALIHPITLMFTKLLGRSAKTDKANALNQLAMASTIWLILCCAMAYGLFLLKQELFFPVMMATIGCRYLIFASVFGRGIFWVLGGSLIVAANMIFFSGAVPLIGAAVGGLIELAVALFMFSKTSVPIKKTEA